jgi:hypothetical protein
VLLLEAFEVLLPFCEVLLGTGHLLGLVVEDWQRVSG